MLESKSVSSHGQQGSLCLVHNYQTCYALQGVVIYMSCVEAFVTGIEQAIKGLLGG